MINANHKELFKQFLAQQGITIQFIIEMKNFSEERYPDIDALFKNLTMLGTEAKGILHAAFIWGETEQGAGYWDRHNTQWVKFLEENL